MGIKGLNKVLKRYAPNATQEKSIYDFSNSKIAIDSGILIYKYIYNEKIKSSGICHLLGFISRIIFYLNRGILPIFVFDGPPPEAKKQVLNKRLEQKQKIEQKIENLDPTQNKEEIEKLSRQIIYVTREHRRECKKIIELFGIPLIEAIGEAEATCVELQKNTSVDYVFTEDTDTLAFGTGTMLKSAKKIDRILEIKLEALLEELGMTHDEFIDFCILCGCDYCPTIPKIASITAYDLIRKYKNIETIIEKINDGTIGGTKTVIPDNFTYQKARDLFKHTIGLKVYDFTIGQANYTEIKKLLVGEKNMDTVEFYTIVRKYIKALTQYNIIHSQNQSQQTSPHLPQFEPFCFESPPLRLPNLILLDDI